MNIQKIIKVSELSRIDVNQVLFYWMKLKEKEIWIKFINGTDFVLSSRTKKEMKEKLNNLDKICLI